MLITLVVMLLSADGSNLRTRTDGDSHVPRVNDRGWNYSPVPAFEFAPSRNAGMPDACTCTNPTGSRGEALTFARNSTANCMKGNLTSGINNGDMVLCAANQPRIQSCGSGGNGLLLEPATTNTAHFTDNFPNVAWNKLSVTVTGDYTAAPNASFNDGGVQQADRIQFQAVSEGSNSEVYQLGTPCTASATNTLSFYIKGNGTSGSIDYWMFAATGGVCTTCAYVADSWTRCSVTSALGTGPDIEFGNLTSAVAQSQGCAAGGRSAQDVFIWGVQCEVQPAVTSYLRAASSNTTRVTEVTTSNPYFTIPSFDTTSGYSMAATVVPEQITTNGVMALAQNSTNFTTMWWSSATNLRCEYDSTGASGTANSTSSALTIGTALRGACTWTGTTDTTLSSKSGNTGTATVAGATNFASTKLYLGGKQPNSGSAFAGCIKNVCLDPDPTRCKP